MATEIRKASVQNMHPNIRTPLDLTNVCEVEDHTTGAFVRTTFSYLDKEQDVVWFGQTATLRKYDLTVRDLHRLLQRIPDDKIYPLHMPSISIALGKHLFVKRPKFLCLDDEAEAKLLPRIFLEEAETLEFLKQHPHPNMIRYHGCTVRRGYITGIALDKYDVMLQNRAPLDIAACMDGIRAGARHLHSLGYAHNDLNPSNIALDSKDNPIILDFGSCKRFGERLLSGGTYGWIDEDYSISAQRHDESAMRRIESWLTEKKKRNLC